MSITVVVSGTGLTTPPDVISNEELVGSFNGWADREDDAGAEAIASGERAPTARSSAEFIERASGIRRRHVVDRAGILDVARMKPRLRRRDENELSLQAEMCLPAARQAMQAAGVNPEEIDLVVVACSNLARPYPAIAIEVQDALGCRGYAFDMNVACSSATFALKVAVDAIRAGTSHRALLLNPEIMTAHVNFRDRDSHFIFGDVCTAMIVEPVKGISGATQPYEVLDVRLLTEFSNHIRNDGGFLNRCEEENETDSHAEERTLFRQNGRRVFKDVVPKVVRFVREQLDDNALGCRDLRRVWLHQANAKMNHLIYEKLFEEAPNEDRAPSVLAEFGNTASAGAIVAFHLHRSGLSAGDLGLLASFGAGYSIGSALLRRL